MILADRYLDLMKKMLTDSIYEVEGNPTLDGGTYAAARRESGYDWPSRAHTMIGLKRLDNLQSCIASIVRENVPGDLMETGVWRGGATIFMRAALEAFGDTGRRVWVADSFRGLPQPDAQFPADAGDRHHEQAPLVVSLDTVRDNFARYGLLDDRVIFLEGWFKETLPTCAVERLSILRLDGDMYESTYVALEALYDRVSPGGYVIVDDYGAVPGCRLAIDAFRAERAISEPMIEVDWTGVYWKKRS